MPGQNGECIIFDLAEFLGSTREVVETLLNDVAKDRIFINSRYQVNIRDVPEELLDHGDQFQAPSGGSSGFAEGFAGAGEHRGGSGLHQPGAWQHPLAAVQHPATSGHNLASLFEEEMDADLDNEVHQVPEDHGDGVCLGLRVRHGQFGRGVIMKIEGEGDNQKVIVKFGIGYKKLLVRFAGLERD